MIKKMILITLATCSLYGVEPAEPVNFDLLSEALGHLIVRQLNQPGFNFQLDHVIRGMRDEKEGKASPMSEEEYEQMICTLQEQNFAQLAEKNLAAADAFLKENAAKEGIQTPDPKLQFTVARWGEGECVENDSIPLIHYTGKLLDGTVFATSESIGEPIALPIKQSIPGFAKGLVGMKEGEKRVLYIHPELAYGVTGQLPPNSLLIFEVEIVKANTQSSEAVVEASS